MLPPRPKTDTQPPVRTFGSPCWEWRESLYLPREVGLPFSPAKLSGRELDLSLSTLFAKGGGPWHGSPPLPPSSSWPGPGVGGPAAGPGGRRPGHPLQTEAPKTGGGGARGKGPLVFFFGEVKGRFTKTYSKDEAQGLLELLGPLFSSTFFLPPSGIPPPGFFLRSDPPWGGVGGSGLTPWGGVPPATLGPTEG